MSKLIRGRLLTFSRRPIGPDDESSYVYIEDGALLVSDGIIVWCGDWDDRPDSQDDLPVEDHRPFLITAGFIDAHTHLPQMRVIASYGARLLDWLENYTFPQEAAFQDAEYCKISARNFLDELARHGVTTAAIMCSSHAQSADALFEEAHRRGQRLISGKTMMDRNAPDSVCDTVRSGYEDSEMLIRRWHGVGRLSYAVSPRFAITSSPAQLEAAGALLRAHPDCYFQTHLSETLAEVEATLELFPEAHDYLDVYESFDLVGTRSLFAHCLHLRPRERMRLAEYRAVAVSCPTSNLFLGSGLFDFHGLDEAGVSLALATDIGAGTRYSMLATAAEAYKVCQLQRKSLDPLDSFHLITRGNAHALGLADKIGSLAVGHEADLVVLDSAATPAMAERMAASQSIVDELFVLQMLGDDRSIVETYIAGEAVKSGLGVNTIRLPHHVEHNVARAQRKP